MQNDGAAKGTSSMASVPIDPLRPGVRKKPERRHSRFLYAGFHKILLPAMSSAVQRGPSGAGSLHPRIDEFSDACAASVDCPTAHTVGTAQAYQGRGGRGCGPGARKGGQGQDFGRDFRFAVGRARALARCHGGECSNTATRPRDDTVQAPAGVSPVSASAASVPAAEVVAAAGAIASPSLTEGASSVAANVEGPRAPAVDDMETPPPVDEKARAGDDESVREKA